MTPTNTSIIHVIGGGSIGLLFAGRLSPFARVHILSRNGDSIATQFSIESPDGSISTYSLDTEHNPQAGIDWLLVCTKSYDAEKAVNLVSARLSENSRIVLLGNGMGYQQRIATNYPSCKVLVASTTEGANRPQIQGTQPAVTCVRHAGTGNTTIGALHSPPNHSIKQDLLALSALLNKASFDNDISENIVMALWRKLIVNCGINPFTAILNCTNGNILRHPFFLTRIDGLCNELADAAQRAGLAISAKECKKSVYLVATATQHNRSSMLQDVTQGKLTEIDFINGFICQQGELHGQDYPINRELTTKVKELSPMSPAVPQG
jgi:2-dehydropantoate 2-reductase